MVFFQPSGWGKISHHHRLEEFMKSSIWDKSDGTQHEVGGKVDEVTAKITDRELKAKDNAEISACSWQAPSQRKMITMRRSEEGKIGWVLLWALGIPIPILVALYLLRGCT
jgi:hypothetical protein